MTESETKVTVVDSIMGKGKTTWAADFMAEHNDRRFIYCAPLLSLLDEMNGRLSGKGCRELYTPSNRGRGKRDHFNTLLMEGRNIGVTHCTFSHANDETVSCLKEGHYTLILDEVLDILVEYNNATGEHMKTRDPKLLQDKGLIRRDEYGRVYWVGDSCEDTQYATVERLAKEGSLFLLDETLLVWQFPPELFRLFDEVYVLTYLFAGSMLCPYFAYHGIPYSMKSVGIDGAGKRFLTEYSEAVEDRLEFSRLITILENDRMNDYGLSALSKRWFSNNKEGRKAIKKNIANYVRGITKVDSRRVMWTTYEERRTELSGAGYTRTRMLTPGERALTGSALERAKASVSCFVPCNARGTNMYSDRDVLIYAMNFYPNEYLLRYFYNKNEVDGTSIAVYRDLISLSAMIQWVWRSAIRNKQPIRIYIPSTRMRTLFKDWLNGSLPK